MKNSFLLLIVVCYLASERSGRKSLLLKQTGDDLIMKLKWPEIDRVKLKVVAVHKGRYWFEVVRIPARGGKIDGPDN